MTKHKLQNTKQKITEVGNTVLLNDYTEILCLVACFLPILFTLMIIARVFVYKKQTSNHPIFFTSQIFK